MAKYKVNLADRTGMIGLMQLLYGEPKDGRVQKVLVPTEKQEHLAFMDWVRRQPEIRDVLIHIPNEGKRSPVEGHILRRMGLKSGVSDFLLARPSGRYHGLFLELKRKEGGREMPAQVEWINKMRELGYAAFFCYGCDSAIETVKAYLSDRLT
jgi:hypothetical protein